LATAVFILAASSGNVFADTHSFLSFNMIKSLKVQSKLKKENSFLIQSIRQLRNVNDKLIND
jgi:hypothetical protein